MRVLPAVELPGDTEDLWTWRGRRYLLRAVAVGDYRRHMRVRSPSWGTVGLPRAWVMLTQGEPAHARAVRAAAGPRTSFALTPSPLLTP